MIKDFKKFFKILLIFLAAFAVLAIVFISINIAAKTTNVAFNHDASGSVASMTRGYSTGISLGSAISDAISPQSVSKNADSYEEIEIDDGADLEGELTEKKIIKNGYLSLYVKSVEEVVQNIQTLALDVDGFVSDSSVHENSSGSKSGSITIRVPVDSFESIIHNVKQLAVEVEYENSSAQDVTEEYIDLEARLRNLEAEETQYLEIMKRSYTIEDTLRVTEHLSNVRGEIEQAQGRLKYLSRQVDMSTITVNLTTDDDVDVFGLRWRPLVVAKKSLKNMFSGLTGYVDAMIGFLFKLPIIILWLITLGAGFLIIWKMTFWFYRKFLSNKIDTKNK